MSSGVWTTSRVGGSAPFELGLRHVGVGRGLVVCIVGWGSGCGTLNVIEKWTNTMRRCGESNDFARH